MKTNLPRRNHQSNYVQEVGLLIGKSFISSISTQPQLSLMEGIGMLEKGIYIDRVGGVDVYQGRAPPEEAYS